MKVEKRPTPIQIQRQRKEPEDKVYFWFEAKSPDATIYPTEKIRIGKSFMTFYLQNQLDDGKVRKFERALRTLS